MRIIFLSALSLFQPQPNPTPRTLRQAVCRCEVEATTHVTLLGGGCRDNSARTALKEKPNDSIDEVTDDGRCPGRLDGRQHRDGTDRVVRLEVVFERLETGPPGHLVRQGQTRLQGPEFV